MQMKLDRCYISPPPNVIIYRTLIHVIISFFIQINIHGIMKRKLVIEFDGLKAVRL